VVGGKLGLFLFYFIYFVKVGFFKLKMELTMVNEVFLGLHNIWGIQ
jgi:hypothetical protein